MRSFLLLFILLEFLNATTINQEDKKLTQFKVQYFNDLTGLKTIKDIAKTQFTNTISNQSSIGYRDGFTWYKFEVKNKSDNNQFIIKLFDTFYDIANLYEYKNNQWIVHKNGLEVDIKKREFQDKHPLFLVNISKEESRVFYLQLTSKLPLIVDIHVYEYEEFLRYYLSKHDILYMFYFGSLFIMIIFNLFLFLTIKEAVYAYYVGYIFFYLMFVFVFAGFNLDIGLQDWYYQFHISPPFLIGFLILFTNKMLNIKKYSPRITQLLYVLAAISFSLFVFVLIDVKTWYPILTVFSTIAFSTLFLSSIYIWKQGNKDAQIYLIALSIYLSSMVLFTAQANGWIPNNNINRYIFLYASFFEIIIFSLMLANRFNKLNKEKIATLEEMQNKEKLLYEQSRLAQMGEMISMIAHQWRQPLGAISSVVVGLKAKIHIKKYDLSKEKDREEFIEILNQKLQNISEYVQFLSTTVDDFRSFFKPDKQKELTSVVSCIEKALEIVHSSMQKNKIEIYLQVQKDKELYIHKNEMIQAILSLLKNSEDNFIEKGIENPFIKISTTITSSRYVIEIQDNGGGISKDILPNIYDPYFSTKKEKNGTGLGLYMARTIVENHNNGELNISNSKEGISCKIILNFN